MREKNTDAHGSEDEDAESPLKAFFDIVKLAIHREPSKTTYISEAQEFCHETRVVPITKAEGITLRVPTHHHNERKCEDDGYKQYFAAGTPEFDFTDTFTAKIFNAPELST
ncbi:hypothetical protein N8T08_005621 [Aspergillus melleus]|uniref:Uncharacterized protein n=1 Tax=Aspergillus melleus TaxID=138277 RepID=A0ACC3B1S5_9EURO|nr:hypothetical protein N8T08_005621 [Aspergillus melleus]